MVEVVREKLSEIRALCEQYDVERLDLVGSAARGDLVPEESDLDFVVLFKRTKGHLSVECYFDLLSDLERLFERKIDLMPRDGLRNPYVRESVMSDRQELYAA